MKIRLLLSAILVWALASPVYGQSGFTSQLNSDFQRLYLQVPRDPNRVLDQLAILEPDFLETDAERAQYYRVLGEAYSYLDYLNRYLLATEAGLRVAPLEAEPWLHYSLLNARSDALLRLGRGQEGLEDVYLVLDFAREYGDAQMEIYALMTLAEIHNEIGLYDRALERLTEAFDIAPLNGDEITRADVNVSIANTYSYMGEEAKALQLYQQSLDQSLQREYWIDAAVTLYNIAMSHQYEGNDKDFWPAIEQAVELFRRGGDERGEIYACILMADQYALEGNPTKAIEMLDSLEAEMTGDEHPRLLFDINISAADAHLQVDQFEQARAHLELAELSLRDTEFPFAQVDLHYMWSLLFAGMGDYESAYYELGLADQLEYDLSSLEVRERFSQLAAAFELDAQQIENELLQEANLLQAEVIATERSRRQTLLALALLSVTFSGLVALFASRLWRQGKHLDHLANHDGLTGLLNRNAALQRSQALLEKNAQDSSVLAIIDLDHFKRINDEYGHLTGDLVLEAFGEMCQRQFRHGEVVGRMGGEEFLIFMPGSSLKSGLKRLKWLQDLTVGMATQLTEPPIRISFSAGVCAREPGDTNDLDELLKCADIALYQAKRAGRDRIQVAELTGQAT